MIHRPEKPGDFKRTAKKWLRLVNKFGNPRTVTMKDEGAVVYCKNCKRPRMIIKGLCPGCMKRGTLVFDTEIQIIKEMSKK